MYANVKAAVKLTEMTISHYFDSLSGVKQGCVVSPLLFSLFVVEFETMLYDSNVRGIFVGQDFFDILLLFYADDLCIFDDSVIGLQRKLNVLKQFSIKWGLNVNLDKTEILVFRYGGKLRATEKWTFGNVQVKMSTYYNYLGLVFSNRLCWSKGINILVQKANNALVSVKQLQYNCTFCFI